MKTNVFVTIILACMLLIMPGCEVIGGIFKAGVWTGVLMIAVVVGVIIFIIAKMAGGGKK